jgi:hypothetical protein
MHISNGHCDGHSIAIYKTKVKASRRALCDRSDPAGIIGNKTCDYTWYE